MALLAAHVGIVARQDSIIVFSLDEQSLKLTQVVVKFCIKNYFIYSAMIH